MLALWILIPLIIHIAGGIATFIFLNSHRKTRGSNPSLAFIWLFISLGLRILAAVFWEFYVFIKLAEWAEEVN